MAAESCQRGAILERNKWVCSVVYLTSGSSWSIGYANRQLVHSDDITANSTSQHLRLALTRVRLIGLFSPLRPSTPNISAVQDIPPPTGHLFRLQHFPPQTICLVRKMNLKMFTFGAIFYPLQLQLSRQSQVFVFELAVGLAAFS